MTATDRFKAEYGEELFERIFHVVHGDADYTDIRLADKYMVNAANYCGYVVYTTPDGQEIICSFATGDMNGAVITHYGADAAPAPQNTGVRFVLDEVRIALEGGTLRHYQRWFWSSQGMIEDKARDYNYDMRVSPTFMVREHYRDWLRQRYLIASEGSDRRE